MKYLFVSLFALSGCLPPYDNRLSSTDGGPPPTEGGTGDMTVGPPKFVEGKVYFPESGIAQNGITVRVDGFNDPKFTTTTDSSGNFSLAIPPMALNQEEYLVLGGTYLSKTILTTYYAPLRLLDGNATMTKGMALEVHAFVNQDDMMGIRGAIEQSLTTHANISDSFSNYSFMYGRVAHGPFKPDYMEAQYQNYTIEIVVDGGAPLSPQKDCKPSTVAGNCCPYYAYNFNCFHTGTCFGAPTTMIAFDAPASPDQFVIVCQADSGPETSYKRLTINQTAPIGSLVNRNDMTPPPAGSAPWPPITVPRIGSSSSAGVIVDWNNNEVLF